MGLLARPTWLVINQIKINTSALSVSVEDFYTNKTVIIGG